MPVVGAAGSDRRIEVRRLCAGGNRIRTIGPAARDGRFDVRQVFSSNRSDQPLSSRGIKLSKLARSSGESEMNQAKFGPVI